jgi:hypothetical protein
MKPRSTTATPSARGTTGAPGSGKGRREDVRGSGIYPGSGPTPPKTATVRTSASLGRGQSAAATARDIVRENWKDYLKDFSSAHEGWTADLEVFQPDQTSRIQAHGLPMEGLSIEGDPPGGIVSISLGDEAANHLTHTISRATRITAMGEDELEIDAADLGRAVIRCRRPPAASSDKAQVAQNPQEGEFGKRMDI